MVVDYTDQHCAARLPDTRQGAVNEQPGGRQEDMLAACVSADLGNVACEDFSVLEMLILFFSADGGVFRQSKFS